MQQLFALLLGNDIDPDFWCLLFDYLPLHEAQPGLSGDQLLGDDGIDHQQLVGSVNFFLPLFFLGCVFFQLDGRRLGIGSGLLSDQDGAVRLVGSRLCARTLLFRFWLWHRGWPRGWFSRT